MLSFKPQWHFYHGVSSTKISGSTKNWGPVLYMYIHTLIYIIYYIYAIDDDIRKGNIERSNYNTVV